MLTGCEKQSKYKLLTTYNTNAGRCYKDLHKSDESGFKDRNTLRFSES
jgi:hypothetical protein